TGKWRVQGHLEQRRHSNGRRMESGRGFTAAYLEEGRGEIDGVPAGSRLTDGHHMVRRHILQNRLFTGWPANRNGIGARGAAQPEVQPHVVLREVTAPAVELVGLHAPRGGYHDPGADGAAIGFRAGEPDQQPVPGRVASLLP